MALIFFFPLNSNDTLKIILFLVFGSTKNNRNVEVVRIISFDNPISFFMNKRSPLSKSQCKTL